MGTPILLKRTRGGRRPPGTERPRKEAACHTSVSGSEGTGPGHVSFCRVSPGRMRVLRDGPSCGNDSQWVTVSQRHKGQGPEPSGTRTGKGMWGTCAGFGFRWTSDQINISGPRQRSWWPLNFTQTRRGQARGAGGADWALLLSAPPGSCPPLPEPRRWRGRDCPHQVGSPALHTCLDR